MGFIKKSICSTSLYSNHYETVAQNTLEAVELGSLDLAPGESWTTPSTCSVFAFSLGPGRYSIEADGAAGSHYSRQETPAGGRTYAELILSSTTKLFAVAGDVGQSEDGTNREVPGRCNGGGAGFSNSSCSQCYFSSGGGASHVAAIKNDLEHRILVAGGASGSYYTVFDDRVYSATGGLGGDIGLDGGFHATLSGYQGKGASQTQAGQGCANEYKGTCSPGSFGRGGNARPPNACGGGAGWFGGASSGNIRAAGGGGSGFIFDGRTGTNCHQIDKHSLRGIIAPLEKGAMERGINRKSGKVKITAIKTSPTPSKSIRPTPSIFDPECDCHKAPNHAGYLVTTLAILLAPKSLASLLPLQ